MLIQSDVCPACGKEHASRRGLLGGGKGECPLVVFGTFPALTSPSDFEDRVPMMPLELPTPMREVPTSVSITRRPGALSVPWPMPSNLEDYL